MKQFYRSLLLLALFLVGGAQLTSNAQVTYTCTGGEGYQKQNGEGCEKMFDGNINTKWLANAGENCYVLFNTSESVYVWGYEFTTANDNEKYSRTQKKWALYGSTTELAQDAAGWVELAAPANNNIIQSKNFYTQRFYCNAGAENTAYKYFKLDILEDGEFQISEFKLCCDTKPVYTYKWAGGEENAKKALDHDLGQKWEGGDLQGKSFIIEANDGKAHALKSYAFTTHDDGNGGCGDRAPKDWVIEGSNDQNAWFSVARVTDGQIQNQNYKTFSYESTAIDLAFRYYKITVNSYKGNNHKQIAEFFAVGGDAFAANVGYKWVSGDKDNLKKALDMNSHEKAEGNSSGLPNDVKFIIETIDEQPHTVRSYTMSTHDDGRCPDRAPKSWILEGSNDQSEWVTIDDVTNDPIKNVDYDVKRFVPSNQDAAVRYLRLTIRSYKGDSWHQLAEFNAVSGCTGHDWVETSRKEATCAENGGPVYTCSICGDVKVDANIPALNHNYSNGFCTGCHAVDPSYMTAVDDFYQPTSVAQFTWLAAKIQAGNTVNIKLTQDVDLAGFAGFGNGDNVVPFQGEFDGQDNSITGLNVSVDAKNVALFGKTEGANIHDLNIVDARVVITGNKQNAGLLIGNAKNTTVNRVAVSGYVEGYDHVGSFVGNVEGGTTISNCMSSAEVKSRVYQAAGYVGTSSGVTIEKCIFTGSVTGQNNSAGFISLLEGNNNSSTITKSIMAASSISSTNNGEEASMANANGRTGTFTNNHISASTFFVKANSTRTYNDANDINGLTTADRDMQCKSFLASTMGWDMTNDWKMVAAGQWPVLAWMDATTPTQTVTITAAGYATIVAAGELDFSESDVEAFAAQDMLTYVHLEPVTFVPAGEPVVIKGAEGSHNISYNVDYASDLTNDLQVSSTDVTANGSQYILAKANDKVGFYKARTGTTITAGKAYLESSNNIGALFFDEDEETAVEAVKAEQNSENVVYNLAGQRIAKMQRGVNIVNGKKVLK